MTLLCADDIGRAEPQRVAVEFIEMFRKACAMVPWTMQCVSCDCPVRSREVKSHTLKDHIVCSHSDMIAVSIMLAHNFV